jgi:hypothetical protein
MILADASSFLGSIWFAVMLGLVGYIAGNVLPIGKLFRKD